MPTWTILPPEVWVHVFEYATHVPGTLEPDIYAHNGLVGANYTKTPVRSALVTKRALVRVCKQWWHLAIPFLYRSVYIGRAHTLSKTLVRSVAGTGTLIGVKPLGEYTQRLDIAMRDHSQSPDADLDSLALLIIRMPHLTIVSFAATDSYFQRSPAHLNSIPDILQRCARSLRVLDWSSRPEPLSQIIDLLNECTQLRILHCRSMILSKERERSIIPPTVTTLRLHAQALGLENSMNCPTISRRPGPWALQELIIDFYSVMHFWEDLLYAYSSQLVSVHFYIHSGRTIDVRGAFRILAQECPRLRRFIITSDPFFFTRPHLVFPSITYLGLRSTRLRSSGVEFEKLFVSLEDLRSRVPSLQVVQLLNEKHVQFLFKTHTNLAVRRLQSFVDAGRTRLEDKDGVLLTGLKSLVSSVTLTD